MVVAMTAHDGPPPGWYPDPTDPAGGYRWWNGHTWTDDTQPAPSPEPEAAPPTPVQPDPIASWNTAGPQVVAPAGGTSPTADDGDDYVDDWDDTDRSPLGRLRVPLAALAVLAVAGVAAFMLLGSGGDDPDTAAPATPPVSAPTGEPVEAVPTPGAPTGDDAWVDTSDGALVADWLGWWRSVTDTLAASNPDAAASAMCTDMLADYDTVYGSGATVANAAATHPDPMVADTTFEATNFALLGLDLCADGQFQVAFEAFMGANDAADRLVATLGL